VNQLLSQKRVEVIAALTGPMDVLVIGGGIVGSGVARDAAMRGLKTGLVEQHDFAAGTSSRSSRLLHGGLRYLAQGRLGLVREASVEKGILHRIAPHLADPLAFIFPTYRNTDWPLWRLRIGVKLYDLLCGGRNLGSSSAMSRDRLLQSLPTLNATNLTGAVRYFDGLTNDARLVLDTIRSASRNGATVLNYAKFRDAVRKSDFWECDIEDQLTGRAYQLQARAIVNATGPWAQGLPQSHVKLRLTKGIHFVIERNRLPVPDAVVLTEGKRILFVIPWGERVIIGTTDTDYHGVIEDVRASDEDVSYVLRIVNEFFPQAAIGPKDIISTWAGLRPLIANPNGTASDISRNHEIKNPEPNWWDVAGGKLTTYRLMAEQTVDQVIAHAKLSGSQCRTAMEPLLEPNETKGVSGILPPQFSHEAVQHACANEWAVHLDDVMIRRTSWHYYYADANGKAAQVADWMAELFGWSANERAEELRHYHAVAGNGISQNTSTSAGTTSK
jgi:glycerol-3-phosphate dehydrogenase